MTWVLGLIVFIDDYANTLLLGHTMRPLSDRLKIRRFKPSFQATNGVRVAVFVTFVAVSTTGILTVTTGRGTFAKSLYDYINPFHGLEFAVPGSALEGVIHYLPFMVVLGLAVVLYRPFCYLACPIGLLTHWVEQVGLFRITKLREPCVDCDLCVSKTLCPAAPEMLKEAELRPDCFACTRCTDVCPKDALVYGTRRAVGIDTGKKGKKKAA